MAAGGRSVLTANLDVWRALASQERRLCRLVCLDEQKYRGGKHRGAPCGENQEATAAPPSAFAGTQWTCRKDLSVRFVTRLRDSASQHQALVDQIGRYFQGKRFSSK
jgi:hypothetical protein